MQFITEVVEFPPLKQPEKAMECMHCFITLAKTYDDDFESYEEDFEDYESDEAVQKVTVKDDDPIALVYKLSNY